jgi:hypothetical protein
MNNSTCGHRKESHVKTIGFLFNVCVHVIDNMCGCLCIGVFQGGIRERWLQRNLLYPEGGRKLTCPFLCTNAHSSTPQKTILFIFAMRTQNLQLLIYLSALTLPLLCPHSYDLLISFSTTACCCHLSEPFALYQLLHTLLSLQLFCLFSVSFLTQSFHLHDGLCCLYCHKLVNRHRVLIDNWIYSTFIAHNYK